MPSVMPGMTSVQMRGEIFEAWSQALRAWLLDANESGLARARELGRAALGQGMRVSKMGALHHEAVSEILALIRDSDDPALQSLAPSDAVVAAGVFFGEGLAAFDSRESE